MGVPPPPFPGFLHVFQVLELDLQTLYHCNCGTYNFVQKMMVLPFLPANGICTMFECLQGQASEPLAEFSKYASSTWINGTTWTPPIGLPLSKLCTQTAKSNPNHAINCRASGWGQLPLYPLIKFLHREARLTSIQIHLMSEKKLKRIQR